MQTGVFCSATQFGVCERLWRRCAAQCLALFRGQHQSRWGHTVSSWIPGQARGGSYRPDDGVPEEGGAGVHFVTSQSLMVWWLLIRLVSKHLLGKPCKSEREVIVFSG